MLDETMIGDGEWEMRSRRLFIVSACTIFLMGSLLLTRDTTRSEKGWFQLQRSFGSYYLFKILEQLNPR